MHTYSIAYEYSRNGIAWTGGSTVVKATSDVGAMKQVKVNIHT